MVIINQTPFITTAQDKVACEEWFVYSKLPWEWQLYVESQMKYSYNMIPDIDNNALISLSKGL